MSHKSKYRKTKNRALHITVLIEESTKGESKPPRDTHTPRYTPSTPPASPVSLSLHYPFVPLAPCLTLSQRCLNGHAARCQPREARVRQSILKQKPSKESLPEEVTGFSTPLRACTHKGREARNAANVQSFFTAGGNLLMYNTILLRGQLFFCTYFFYFFAPWPMREGRRGAGVKSNL